MLFAHDTTAALLLAADLVNSDDLIGPAGPDRSASSVNSASRDSAAALEALLGRHQLDPRRRPTAADLTAVVALRSRLRAVWLATGTEERAALVNDLLCDSGARPRLVDHGGGWGWHLHVTAHDAALEHRLAAQAGFAFADLVRLGEADRLRRCQAPGCEAVFTDLSRNRSRRYCDTGNCGNRQHVAAYRDRLAAREASRGA